MGRDLAMLNEAIVNFQDFATVRFYEWKPKCISLGKNQKDDINIQGIDKVRRPTGGRALLHDKELTYCFVSPAFETSVVNSYKEISNSLIIGFKKLGIELEWGERRGENMKYCMNTLSFADIGHRGKKFIGSAQFRSKGYILQHGSIPYSLDYEFIEKIFGQKVIKENIITLDEINKNITKEQLIGALKYGFEENFKNREIV